MRQAEACAEVFKYYFGLTGHQVKLLFDLVLHGPAKVKAMLWQRLGRCLVVWLITSGILATGSSVLLLGWPVQVTNTAAFFGLIIIMSTVLLPWLLSGSMLFHAWADLRFLQRGVPLVAGAAPRPSRCSYWIVSFPGYLANRPVQYMCPPSQLPSMQRCGCCSVTAQRSAKWLSCPVMSPA